MSKPLNTVFLVDKTKDSGNGHYERCKSLEKIFQNKKGIKYIFNNFRNFTLNSLETENCIIDSYKINYSLEKEIKKKCKKLITIDDTDAKRKFASDIIINYAPFVKKKFYKNRINFKCKLLLGSDFNFVRGFSSKVNLKNKKKFNVFIYLGIKKRLKKIKELQIKARKQKKINKIFIFGNGTKKVSRKIFLKKMSESDIVLTSAGVTMQEALSKRKIIFAHYFSKNQKQYYDYYKSKKEIYDLKAFENFIKFSSKKIISILNSKINNKKFNQKFDKIIYIKNTINPLKDNLGRNIIIKEYNKKFIKKIYRLQSKQNRVFFQNQNNFSYSTHKLYISKFFKNENNLIFLFFVNKSMAGYIKFVFKQKKYDTSIIIDKKFRSLGIAQKVLFYFKNNKLLPYNITAKVMKKNIQSITAFRKAGFKERDLKII
jgi:spore coat polysaccharide biosynthesis predicted glycosyltransferase SpsG